MSRAAALLLAAAMLAGGAARSADPAVGPSAADPDWHIPPPPADAGEPTHPQYRALGAALGRWSAAAAGPEPPPVAAGGPLAAGARDPRVEQLRNRLRATGDYAADMGADPWYFEPALDRALRAVQRRHGLVEDGILGERSLAAVNTPAAEIAGRIEVARERWRWLPRDLGARHAWVNIPRARLDWVEDGRVALSMRVVVGHRERPTPSLAGPIDRVVFNPTWSVPPRLAVEDLLPRQRADAGFLARGGFRVYGASGAEIAPARVDWWRLGPDRFPYRLVQDAGPGNSLGRIKIAFANDHDIYLHDTPVRGLFGLDGRWLSSGCVRLEEAAALATRVLALDREWSEADTVAAIAAARTRTINLRRTTPAWLVYITTWVEDDGELRLARDIYDRDAAVLAALHPPAP
jgi:murein L,D-transpeptidase YcbB/YkuD